MFPKREDLLEWVRRVGYVIVIRFERTNGKQGSKIYVLLGCEKLWGGGGNKVDVEVTVTSTRKYHCPFKL